MFPYRHRTQVQNTVMKRNASSLLEYTLLPETFAPLTTPLLKHNHLLVIVLCYPVVYYLFERGLQTAFQTRFPKKWQALHSRNKVKPFFALALGCVGTFLSTSTCYQAFLELPTRSTLNFARPGYAEVCVGTRSLFWMEELSRMGVETHYLLHHVMSLFLVVSSVWFELPGIKYLCGIIASLVTEIGTNATVMLGYCNIRPKSHVWVWWMEFFNLVATIVVRIPAAYIACVSPWHKGLSWTQQAVWMGPLAVYFAYQVYVTHARIRRLRSCLEGENLQLATAQ